MEMRKLRNAILEEMAHLIRIGAIEPVKVNAEQITNRVMAHVECASSPEREEDGEQEITRAIAQSQTSTELDMVQKWYKQKLLDCAGDATRALLERFDIRRKR